MRWTTQHRGKKGLASSGIRIHDPSLRYHVHSNRSKSVPLVLRSSYATLHNARHRGFMSTPLYFHIVAKPEIYAAWTATFHIGPNVLTCYRSRGQTVAREPYTALLKPLGRIVGISFCYEIIKYDVVLFLWWGAVRHSSKETSPWLNEAPLWQLIVLQWRN
jgi:hypothetical protein